MYLNIWSIVVIRNWHWCQLRVYTRTQTVREFIYVDLNRNHQSTHKFVYNFFWMGVTNWNFYHLAEERVYRHSFLSRLSRKSAAKRGREEMGGHCCTVNSGATRTPSMFTPIYCLYPYPVLHNPWRIDAESVTEFLRAFHMLQLHSQPRPRPRPVATYSHSTVSPVAIINS